MREQLVELGVSEFNVASGIFQLSEAEESRVTTASGDVSFSALRHIMLDLGSALVSNYLLIFVPHSLVNICIDYRPHVSDSPHFPEPTGRRHRGQGSLVPSSGGVRALQQKRRVHARCEAVRENR